MDEHPNLDRALILDWRSSERMRVVSTLDDRISGLLRDVTGKIDEFTIAETLRLGRTHNEKIAPVVEKWLQDQYQELQLNIEKSADASEEAISDSGNQYLWSWEEIAGVAAGSFLTVAPMAAVPMAAGLATVTTTTLFLFTTSAVSIPILTAIIAGSVATGIGGHKIRSWTIERLKRRYRRQVEQEIRNKVFGDPANETSPSLMRFFLKEIDLATKRRLEAHR